MGPRKIRKARLEEIQKYVETSIMMTDTTDDLIYLATLFITTGKNILIKRYGTHKTMDTIVRMFKENT